MKGSDRWLLVELLIDRNFSRKVAGKGFRTGECNDGSKAEKPCNGR